MDDITVYGSLSLASGPVNCICSFIVLPRSLLWSRFGRGFDPLLLLVLFPIILLFLLLLFLFPLLFVLLLLLLLQVLLLCIYLVVFFLMFSLLLLSRSTHPPLSPPPPSPYSLKFDHHLHLSSVTSSFALLIFKLIMDVMSNNQ